MQLKQAILQLAGKQDTFRTKDVWDLVDRRVTRQQVSAVIRGLVNQGALVKSGNTKSTQYALAEKQNFLEPQVSLELATNQIEEHETFSKLRSQAFFLQNLPENLDSILFYVFTEILNNAIEHSQSARVTVAISQTTDNRLKLLINDHGIGVFRNVMQKRHLASELEAMQDLLKGKTTTAPHSHSGEGIFFTSKIVDTFILESYGYRLLVDNTIPDVFLDQNTSKNKGTQVTCFLSKTTQKHLSDIFSSYVTDVGEVGFDKTEIKVKLFITGTTYISRSQARRILAGLDKFRTIILDFQDVTTVGQAFADEIFRVFQARHPKIVIKPLNAIDPVQFMIDRVEKPVRQ